MERFSTRAAMVARLQALHDSVQAVEGFVAGTNAGLIGALPIAARPENSHDLDRGVWVRDDRGNIVWLRANT